MPSKKGSATKSKTSKTNKHDWRKTAIGILLIFLSIFFYIALIIKKSGFIGGFTRSCLLGFFGLGAFIFPLIFLIISIKLLMKNSKIGNQYLAGIITFLNILCLLFMRNYDVFNYERTSLITLLKDSYIQGGNYIGGGIFGNLLGKVVKGLLGTLGAYLFIVAVFVLAFIIYKNVSMKTIKTTIDKTKLDMQEGKERRAKERAQREEQEEQERMLLEGQAEQEVEVNNEEQDLGIIFDYKKELKGIVTPTINNKTVNDEEIPYISPDTIVSMGGGAETELHTTLKMKTKKSTENIEVVPIPIKINNNAEIDIYKLPSLDLLNKVKTKNPGMANKESMDNAKILNEMLKDFGVGAIVSNITKGPAVTRYELQLNPGVKVSKILGLSDDIALSLASPGIRIEAPIPGKSAVGIEVPNKTVSPIGLREILDTNDFKTSQSKVSFGIGKDIAGDIMVADLGKMPHLLIAGATGSGKSVCINTLIASILFKAKPDEVKLIMIDPKVVELSVYNDIPHLLIPVVTEPKKAASALNWAVMEMTERYKIFAKAAVRDIKGYNAKEGIENKMPQIVIIIDELADLMMVSPGEIEEYICRLAQMARAAGMHLVVATQRPSVDVITGLIKANIPSRISFAVSSATDSRTILDMGGAEKLLGKGDMLYFPAGESKPKRVQGAFISDIEVEALVDYLKNQSSALYDVNVIERLDTQPVVSDENADALLGKATEIVVEYQQASASMLQRKLKIGYNRAATLIEELEKRKVIGEYEGSKPRKVLMSKEELMIIDEVIEEKEIF